MSEPVPPGRVRLPFDAYRGLPRSIYALFFARIVNSIGSFVHPFMTLFLTDRLGLGKGAAGRYLFLASLAFVPGSIIAGRASDRIGRKKVLVFSQIASALCFLPCGFLGESMIIPWFLIAAQFFLGGVYPVSQAITADLTTADRRQAAFSLIYLGTNIGYAAGPLIAGFLYLHKTPWLFFGDAGTTFLAVIVIVFFVGESKPTGQQIAEAFQHTGDERSEIGGAVAVLLRRPFLLAFLFIVPLLNVVYSQLSFALPVYMMELFSDRGSYVYGMIMTVNALTVAVATTLVVSAARRLRPVTAVAVSALFYCVGFGFFLWADTLLPILLCVVVLTIGEILSFTNTSVYVANHTPITHRGRLNAIFPILLGAGAAVGPPLAGPFIERYGVRMVWPAAALLSIVVFSLLLLLAEVERRVRK